MKIIILGAGRVGSTLAEHLSNEHHDITVVDRNPDLLSALQNRLDIRTVFGHAAYPSVLRDAGAEKADMIVGVTDADEINMMACQVGYSLFKIPKKIARVRSQDYFYEKELFSEENMPVDVFISPEKLVIDYIRGLIEYPGADQVLEFAKGKIMCVGVKPFYGGSLVGKPLQKISELLPNVPWRITAIYRENKLISLGADTTIEVGDELFFVAPRQYVYPIMTALRKTDAPYQNIVIAGGGNIGAGLTVLLEENYQVKLIEKSKLRCAHLAQNMRHATVLQGEATDQDLLISENIEHMDLFCAVTSQDEDNILACMLAKKKGVRHTLALINHPSYLELTEDTNINHVISPEQATVSSILAHVRGEAVLNVHALRQKNAEAIEMLALGTRKTSQVVGRKVKEIKLPESVVVAAILREDDVIFPGLDTVIAANDRVVLFVGDKKVIQEVEGLFRVE